MFIRTVIPRRKKVIVISLSDDVERRAFHYVVLCGIREAAGPGNKNVWEKMHEWKKKTEWGQ